jgi:glutaredoxin
MGLFDGWRDSQSGGNLDDLPSPDAPRELVLYKSDRCGYCFRVYRAIDKLGLTIEMRDVLARSGTRAELMQRTGRGQVPCLFIDGEPLFESADIVTWLERYAAANPQAST